MKYLLVALLVWAGVAQAAPTVHWSIPIGETDADVDEVDGIGMDADGNTIVSGVFRTGIVLGGRTFTSRGLGDIFVASYDPAGAFRWAGSSARRARTIPLICKPCRAGKPSRAAGSPARLISAA